MPTSDKYLRGFEAQRLLDPFRREVEPSPGDLGFAVSMCRSIDADKRQVSGLLSSAAVDRYGEVIVPSAFAKSLPAFRRNPVFLAGHRHTNQDGTSAVIGTWPRMEVTAEGLEGTAQFLPAGDKLADNWWTRFAAGAVKAFSVGFIANAWEMRTVEIGQEKRLVRHFTDVELLEVSAVSIPANPEALVKSLGGLDPAQARGGTPSIDVPTAMVNLIEKAVRTAIDEALQRAFDPDSGHLLESHLIRVIRATRECDGDHGRGLDDATGKGAAGMDLASLTALRDALVAG